MCGRLRNRQRTFWQTLNPFNRNADGVPKTMVEIEAELGVEAAAWKREPPVCAGCER